MNLNGGLPVFVGKSFYGTSSSKSSNIKPDVVFDMLHIIAAYVLDVSFEQRHRTQDELITGAIESVCKAIRCILSVTVLAANKTLKHNSNGMEHVIARAAIQTVQATVKSKLAKSKCKTSVVSGVYNMEQHALGICLSDPVSSGPAATQCHNIQVDQMIPLGIRPVGKKKPDDYPTLSTNIKKGSMEQSTMQFEHRVSHIKDSSKLADSHGDYNLVVYLSFCDCLNRLGFSEPIVYPSNILSNGG